MIRQVQGKVLSLTHTGVVIDVAGFGIEVRTTQNENSKAGDLMTLATHMVLKKDGIELYGFQDPADRDFFELILTVSGVGPKTAQSVLRRSSRTALAGAISKKDVTYLTKIVGLGKKSAEKMLVELSDKVGEQAHDDADGEVFDTLVALGYSEREARKAIQNIPEGILGKDARLKASLSAGS